MSRPLLVLAILALSLAVAWDAGERHRANCERSGKTSCSVLPWDTGSCETQAAGPDTRPDTPATIERRAIEEEARRILAAQGGAVSSTACS